MSTPPRDEKSLRKDDRLRAEARRKKSAQAPKPPSRGAKKPGRGKDHGRDERRDGRSGGRRGSRESRETRRKEGTGKGAEQYSRPIREDLVTQACLEAYGSIRHEGRLSDRALDFALRTKKNLYSNERRAVAERVYALLRRQLTVDHLLTDARPGFEALGTTSKDLMRLCASRVLMGEDAIAVAKSVGLEASDQRVLLSLPDAAARIEQLPREQRFAVAASLPDFLAAKMREEFGDQAETAAEAMNERAPLTARVNTLKGSREALIAALREEGVECRPTPLSPLGVFLETRLNAFGLESFRNGLFELQDEGSQLLGMLVDPPPTKVIDACAGAGGKTLQLAAEMGNRGELFALDIEPKRLDELKKRARRDGVHNVRIRAIPPDEPSALAALKDLEGKADRVLVDAPCSGTGTYRRKPDARYRLTPEALDEHVARQKRLLAQFARLVKPGGRIVYGTCSVLRMENEDVIADFLARHPEFSVRPVHEELGEPLAAQVASKDGFLRLTSHRHGTDGFFGAILVRQKS